MLRWLSLLIDKKVRAAAQRARRYVHEAHPSWRVGGLRLRAEEVGEQGTRYVFAVFYRQPGVTTRPGRYIVVVVRGEEGAVSESDDPRYRISALK